MNNRDGKTEWLWTDGRQLAEYAFQSGVLFPMIAGRALASQGWWLKDFPGIEAEPRLVRPVSGRGVHRRARAR